MSTEVQSEAGTIGPAVIPPEAAQLTARAIREGKNLEGLVAEILEGEAAAGGDEGR